MTKYIVVDWENQRINTLTVRNEEDIDEKLLREINDGSKDLIQRDGEEYRKAMIQVNEPEDEEEEETIEIEDWELI